MTDIETMSLGDIGREIKRRAEMAREAGVVVWTDLSTVGDLLAQVDDAMPAAYVCYPLEAAQRAGRLVPCVVRPGPKVGMLIVSKLDHGK